MTLLNHPADATTTAPDLPRSYDSSREPWKAPGDAKLVVSVLLHAPSYLDDPPAGATTPTSMQGGVGRDTSEPKHGQVARLSQWDFGLTTGIWRLLRIAEKQGVPVAVALDAAGVREVPGLAKGVAGSPAVAEVVVRGQAANVILSPTMTEEQERAYIRDSRAAIEAYTGLTATGWFGPERASTPRTSALLREEGFAWVGDWPIDEVPVPLSGASEGLTALTFPLETEDMFELYTRGIPFTDYEDVLTRTIDQLVDDAAITGSRHLGLSWFGWASGQAAFADVAERTLAALVAHPDVAIMTPGEVAALR